MPIEIATVRSPEDLRDIFRLRHEVFVEQEQDLTARTNGLLHDEFDAYSSTRQILARVDGVPAAAVRVASVASTGFPWDGLRTFSGFEGSAAGSSVAVGMMVCAAAQRGHRGLLLGLLRMVSRVTRAQGATHVLAAVNGRFARTLERIGFRRLGHETPQADVGGMIVPMHLKMGAFAPAYQAEFAPEDLVGFGDPFVRRLARKGETMLEVGQQVSTAYVIGRGEVLITTLDAEPQRRGAGAVLGLAELVTKRPCRSLAEAATTGTELIPLSASDIRLNSQAALAALANTLLGDDIAVAADPGLIRQAA